jgi:hypothetical protein
MSTMVGTVEIPAKSTVAAMNRSDLDALSDELGLDTDTFSTRADVIEAIEGARAGTPEPTEGEEDSLYPPYMDIVPGERPDTEEPVADPLTGFILVNVTNPDQDPVNGDTVFFNTDLPPQDPPRFVRVLVVHEDGTPLFQLDTPAEPMRTQPFVLGGTSLWTEHHDEGGQGTATFVTVGSDGEEVEGASISFTVADKV